MEKLVVIDGNSILNRAFYGIMSSKMLQTADGTYTNAVYGFLAILFKMYEDVKPEYLAVAFDLKAPTLRHQMYADYKGTRKGMPDELKMQMPIIKNVLKAMNITIIEKEGYEADDVLGTLSCMGEKDGKEVILLTGDRDSFQLATDKVVIRIPRTKQGKTETENFDKDKIFETYGVLPRQMIDVKGLMGDASDNIPGVPGIGEKTALSLIQKYGSIEHLYEELDAGRAEDVKGKTREKIVDNKELAFLSKKLGTIILDAPIGFTVEDLKVKEWNNEEVLSIFKELRFNRYIERFGLENQVTTPKIDVENLFEKVDISSKEVIDIIKTQKELIYQFETVVDNNEDNIIKEKIKFINIYDKEKNAVYTLEFNKDDFKEVFESTEIDKIGSKVKKDNILLRQIGIVPNSITFDTSIAGYLLNSITNAYLPADLAMQYLDLDISSYGKKEEAKDDEQASLFEEKPEKVLPNEKYAVEVYAIGKLRDVLTEELKKIDSYDLFKDIEMPTAEVLAQMQYDGVYVDERELIKFGNSLKKKIEELRIDIYKLAGDDEFNINSPKQLGEVLFEKLKLEPFKKTKSGYSTDVDALEKIRDKHPIVDKILEYRQLTKLNSTYVEGMIPFINPKTGRVHTFFHQTVTATGRLSSTEPNLQNIPTRTELGKKLRKAFKAEDGKVFLDADYSQIELRVLAHMSEDKIMVEAFKTGQDIHTICASQIFNVPVEEVSKQLRSRAKAVNFGIVYGISDFGLAEQTDMKVKDAKKYIEQYLNTYSGIRDFMSEIVESAKRKGFVKTEFNRRRYIPELNSNNYMVRKFGERAAMNTPIQGTAADIMKKAMIDVYRALKERGLKSKIVLQIHDELLIETEENEIDEVKEILKSCMENVITLKVPLLVEIDEGKSWFQAK